MIRMSANQLDPAEVRETSAYRVCLISPGHVSSNPRLVKEANALHEAGYQVQVVAGDYMPVIRALDDTLLSDAPWQWTKIGLGSRFGYGLRRIRQELAKQLSKRGLLSLSIATWAHSAMSMRLANAAAQEPADLYIAHCLAALPAAAYAAKMHGAKLGFDAEDYHTGELCNTPENTSEIAIRDYLERTLLPKCDHLTGASPNISSAYLERYGVKMLPILNVFSYAESSYRGNFENPSANLESNDIDVMPSLYWFSQTVGPGRGLESIIQAMGEMKTPVRLSLRGLIRDDYRQQLCQLAKDCNLHNQLCFLPSAPPDDMVKLAAEHDIGLSLELTTPSNRDICLTNKVFTYLSAGLPVVLSRTTAQVELASHLESAAILIDLNEYKEIAIRLDCLLSDPEKISKAANKARHIGQSCYNWSLERRAFLASVAQTLTRN